QSITGDTDDQGLVSRDAALVDQLPGDGQRHPTGSLCPDAFSAGQQTDRVDDLRVAGLFTPATRLADRLHDVVAIRRVADPQRAVNALGGGPRLHRADDLAAGVNGIHDRWAGL